MGRSKCLLSLLVVCLVIWFASPALGAIIRVKWNSPTNGLGNDWAHACHTVADGLAVAVSGDEVWVAGNAANPYIERIVLKAGVGLYGGFAGTETARDERDWCVNVTIVDGSQGDSVVRSPSGATATTIIDGFTIRNGARFDYGGGICCSGSSPTISNNVISGSRAGYGGGVYCSNGSPTISKNTITGNSADGFGGGIYCINSSAVISNNTITGNIGGHVDGGGGIYCKGASPQILNNCIVANGAVYGGGIYSNGCSGVVSGNTIVANNAQKGGGVYCYGSVAPQLSNNIVAFNTSGVYAVPEAQPILTRNCIYNPSGDNYSGWLSPGATDIQVDPKLVAFQYGQLHIQPDSPCRDTGYDAAVQAGWEDMDGQARVQGEHVDIGADESNGASWTFTPVVIRVSPSGDDGSDGSTWASAKRTIQAGIDAASAQAGDVWVVGGTYSERIVLRPYVRLYGGFAGTESARDDRNRAANLTVLESGGTGNVVQARTGGTGGIDGFTIRNGRGNGIYCDCASPAIANNTITAHSGSGIYGYCSAAVVSGNVITANSAGGIGCEYGSPTVTGNVIARNTKTGDGGGIYCSESSATVSNNTIKANTATGNGGGIHSTRGSSIIVNNIIAANGAAGGGGIYCGGYSGSWTVANNTIVGNSGGIYGGGIRCFDYMPIAISNNIVAFNSSGIYGASSTPVLKNNCVYNPIGSNYYGLSAGATDIQIDPKLVAVQYCQMHIQGDSPCRDTGDDTAVQSGWVDMDGQDRIQGTHVDIGADESDGSMWAVTPLVVRVSTSGNDGNDGSTWALAKRTVQAGVNAASAQNGEVWVAAGTYNECITLPEYVSLYGGFAGIEDARDERDRIANLTVIDGGGAGSVVKAQAGSYVVDGFTLQHGAAANGGGIYCCGMITISNNTITTNTATTGGGIYCNSAATISCNTITGNTADGGGIYCSSCSPIISNNAITRNFASKGGGVYCDASSPKVFSNFVTANTASSYGGGIYLSSSKPSISNNTITSNCSPSGAGLYNASSASVISNNVIAFNASGVYSGGTSIPVLANNCLHNPGGYNYSGLSAGSGDIQSDPKLVAARYGEVHIQPDSPCRDAGNDAAVQDDWLDLDGQARVQGAHVDIGADESDGTTYTFRPAIVRVSPSGNDGNDGSSWALAKRTVQAGISTTIAQGGEVWVAAGTYYERVTLPPYVDLYGGFAGTENSRDERNWISNVAVLDGSRAGSVVTIQSANTGCVDGLTIQNGAGTTGGGINCSVSSPAIANNTVTTNAATTYGGGIYCSASSPTITNNTVTANTSGSDGGGIYGTASSPAIIGNSVVSNTAGNNGGGICCGMNACAWPISNNIIETNIATKLGGGIYCNNDFVSISNNVISANTANDSGGGVYFYTCGPAVANNVITGNTASTNGGGVYCYSSAPRISSNTVAENTASANGGGIYCSYSAARISDNIVFSNSSGIYKTGTTTPVLRNNCVHNPSGYDYSGLTAGTGDISLDPLLTADYHLTSGSPCINAGWDSAAGITAFDMDGQQRLNGVIDIGADEYWRPYSTVDILDAKTLASGDICTLNAIVTAAFTDFFYIESDNRISGIRVNKAGHTLEAGMRADVFGHPATHDNERCIDADDAHQSDAPNNTGTVAPFVLHNRFLGGFDFGLQPGITGVKGLNNIGLLVRISGRVVQVEPVTEPAVPTWFKVDDGTGRSIKCLVPSGVTIDPTWNNVTVTGISSCETVGTQIYSLLRVRTQGDIVPH